MKAWLKSILSIKCMSEIFTSIAYSCVTLLSFFLLKTRKQSTKTYCLTVFFLNSHFVLLEMELQNFHTRNCSKWNYKTSVPDTAVMIAFVVYIFPHLQNMPVT